MLSKRLSAIAQLVNKNSILADIGSDHGLLPVFLAKENKVQKAYAVDNKVGPLSFSKENISKYMLEDKVIPVLADGLDNLNADTTSVVIAGMGFMTIKVILETNLNLLNNLEQVIIQSNTEINLLRKWIMDKNYLIDNEVIVKENKKFYTIISFNPQITKHYKEDEYLISKYLLDKEDNLYLEFLRNRKNKLTKINKYKNNEEIKKEINIIIDELKKK